ncbi:MAG: His/Gly/Thr/Pro-type tRNA ligase C-terminal domain-containing protein [Endomicrobia bacterium]|nr:His/Gly/Thr/Pro-type tRNA ligase C-terminal domain-containing protein [Endomicrobiia bacterium]
MFCTPQNVAEEILNLLDSVVTILNKFGFKEYNIKLSTRPEKFIGDIHQWYLAEEALKTALESKKLKYEIDPGEGVFYGPKIDIKIKDAIGRLWQCSTIQVDFNLPQRFDVKYRDRDGQDKYVIMIHRALLGSLERFFAVLIENYAGVFPLWLAPVQIRILPVSDKFVKYAEEVSHELEKHNFRLEIDRSDSTLQYKIREAISKKIPYIIIIGQKEQQNNQISIRKYGSDKTEVLTIDKFLLQLEEEINKS